MTRPWDLPAREITPESALLSPRRWLTLLEIGAAGVAAAGAGAGLWWWNAGGDADVLAAGKVTTDGRPFPAPRNARFEIDRPLTAEAVAARYCNFYEFSSTKQEQKRGRESIRSERLPTPFFHSSIRLPTPFVHSAKGRVAAGGAAGDNGRVRPREKSHAADIDRHVTCHPRRRRRLRGGA